MTDTLKQDDAAALVHWTYSRDEWKNFVRWKKRKKGFLHYIFHRLFSTASPKNPNIKITNDKVSINDRHEPFQDADRRLQRVDIRETGNMNVMEIGYERSHEKGKISNEIHIPVPKGKLREAIRVVERLNIIRGSA